MSKGGEGSGVSFPGQIITGTNDNVTCPSRIVTSSSHDAGTPNQFVVIHSDFEKRKKVTDEKILFPFDDPEFMKRFKKSKENKGK